MVKFCIMLVVVQILGSSCIGIGTGENFENLEQFLKEEVLIRNTRAVIRTDAEQARAIVEIETKNANKFVDFTLNAFGKILKNTKRNEISLPEKRKEIDKRILGIRFRAYANFYNGGIKGLENIHRIGDAMLIDAEPNDSLGLAFNIELKDIEVSYGFNISLLGIGPKGQMRGKLKSINIHFKINMSPDGDLTVEDFDVTDIGILTVRTSGLGPLNFIFSGLGIVIGNLGKRILLESLEDKIKNLMNEVLLNLTTDSQKRGLSFMVKALLIRERVTVTPSPIIKRRIVVTPSPIIKRTILVTPSPIIKRTILVTPSPIIKRTIVVTPSPINKRVSSQSYTPHSFETLSKEIDNLEKTLDELEEMTGNK